MQTPFIPFNLLPSITHLNLSILEDLNWPLGKPITKVANIGSSNLTYIRGLNQPVDKFPESLKFLVLGFQFDSPLPILPPSLTHLSFGESLFNHQIDNLPSSLTFLEFNELFNSPIDFNSAPNLTHLIFGRAFDQPIDGFLPSSLTHIHFGEHFQFSLDHLPQHLTHLFLNGLYFDHTLYKLPSSLKSFSTYHYSKPLLSLPPNITHLRATMEANFTFLPFITHLDTTISTTSPFEVSSRFPSLTHLILSMHTASIPLCGSLPESLTHLQCYNYTGKHLILPPLPSNITFLYLVETSCSKFPNSLRYLHIYTKSSSYPPPALPDSLTHLWTTNKLPATIPYSVTHLCMEGAFLKAPLPPSITHLQLFLRYAFNQDISPFLPPALVFLSLEGYESPIENFPDSITTLCISCRNITMLPNSLKMLKGSADLVYGYPHVQVVGGDTVDLDFPAMENHFLWSAQYKKLHFEVVNF